MRVEHRPLAALRSAAVRAAVLGTAALACAACAVESDATAGDSADALSHTTVSLTATVEATFDLKIGTYGSVEKTACVKVGKGMDCDDIDKMSDPEALCSYVAAFAKPGEVFGAGVLTSRLLGTEVDVRSMFFPDARVTGTKRTDSRSFEQVITCKVSIADGPNRFGIEHPRTVTITVPKDNPNLAKVDGKVYEFPITLPEKLVYGGSFMYGVVIEGDMDLLHRVPMRKAGSFKITYAPLQ